LRSWFCMSTSTEVTEAVRFVQRILATGRTGSTTRRRLQLALAEAANWQALDQRTRELHKSTLNNALRSLLSPAARDLFDESKGRRFNPADVLGGKILVASLNSISHPHLASLLFKALKRDYYEAVLSRPVANPETDRLCGLILDELSLSIMPDDVSALAVLRSKGGFVVACAQGLNGLDEVIGRRQRVALLANFNSFFYFSAREEQTDEHAMLTLGAHEKLTESTSPGTYVSIQTEVPPQSGQLRWICPPGSLARLPQHHVYARLANGTVTTSPVWLEAQFHQFIHVPVPIVTDDLAEAIASLQQQDDEAAKAKAGPSLLLLHMHRKRLPLRLTPNVIAAAWQLCRPKVRRTQALAKLSGRIQGIENLPSCWLIGLARWLEKNATLAPSIIGANVKSGILWPELDPAWTLWGDGPLSIPEAINLFIYPSLWRPLLTRHRAQLLTERPDLRAEIDALPHDTPGTGGF
ncbi:MAG TPA: type IV secretion system DNA-binding domain-containing protein, partial [Clostridia bacterium]|nr:type IV secretion system DNA-binding domain-containing protein [Clostridia bacterium]